MVKISSKVMCNKTTGCEVFFTCGNTEATGSFVQNQFCGVMGQNHSAVGWSDNGKMEVDTM